MLCDYPDVDVDVFGSKLPSGENRYYFQPYSDTRVSPLIHCIIKDDFTTAKMLIEHGASINFADSNKMTPLMHAVRVVS